jgi:hypothetical protein
MGKIERIDVSADDRERLHRLARDRNTPQKVGDVSIHVSGELKGVLVLGRPKP